MSYWLVVGITARASYIYIYIYICVCVCVTQAKIKCSQIKIYAPKIDQSDCFVSVMCFVMQILKENNKS